MYLQVGLLLRGAPEVEPPALLRSDESRERRHDVVLLLGLLEDGVCSQQLVLDLWVVLGLSDFGLIVREEANPPPTSCSVCAQLEGDDKERSADLNNTIPQKKKTQRQLTPHVELIIT